MSKQIGKFALKMLIYINMVEDQMPLIQIIK